MNPDDLKKLLRAVASGRVRIAEAVVQLRRLPFDDIGYARVDHHRQLRRGFPEIVFGEGKTPGQCAGIVDSIAAARQPVIVTRATRQQYEAIQESHPSAEWHESARVITLRVHGLASAGRATVRRGRKAKREEVLVLTAGTSDIPIAEEAALTLDMLGAGVGRLYDVGVAGIHRLAGERKRLEDADVLIVVAGMEGALPSVVAGMVSTPVIGVPTSVGYGVSLGGLTALFGMLSSCTGGLTVVNIDNGFGAGYAAALMVRRLRR
jgi:hypothetical protein